MLLQPERWLRIRKLEAQGPSNSYFWMQAYLHGILSYVLHASAQFGASLNEVRRWGGVGRFDKGHAKKWFFRAWKIVFLQSWACLSFMRAVRKKIEPEKLEAVDWKQSKHMRKASVFFKLLENTMLQVPKSTHILSLRGLEAVQACAKKHRNWKNCFSAKPRLHPIRP